MHGKAYRRKGKVVSRSSRNMAKFRHLGTTVANQNLIHKEVNSRLNSRNVCYRSFQDIVSSRLLSKIINIERHETKILPVVWYGCETWSLTLREERRLRVFEGRVLRSIFGPKRVEVMGSWRKLHNRELVTCVLRQIE
jgi:hypothetical protein